MAVSPDLCYLSAQCHLCMVTFHESRVVGSGMSTVNWWCTVSHECMTTSLLRILNTRPISLRLVVWKKPFTPSEPVTTFFGREETVQAQRCAFRQWWKRTEVAVRSLYRQGAGGPSSNSLCSSDFRFSIRRTLLAINTYKTSLSLTFHPIYYYFS